MIKMTFQCMAMCLSISTQAQFLKIKERDLMKENKLMFEALSIYAAESAPLFSQIETKDEEFLPVGVIKVLFWKDAKGHEIWKAGVVLEDSYRDNLPSYFTIVADERLVLFYQANKGKEMVNPVDPEALKEYEELVSDRVYKRIKQTGYRYVKSYDLTTMKYSIIKAYYGVEDQKKNTGSFKWPRTAVLGNPYRITNFEFDSAGNTLKKAMDY
jgi:hypothetical protein